MWSPCYFAALQIKVSPGPIGGRKYRSLLILPQRDLLIVVEGVGPGKTNRIKQGCALLLSRSTKITSSQGLDPHTFESPRSDSAPSSSFPSLASDLITRSSVAALAVPASSFGHSPRGGTCARVSYASAKVEYRTLRHKKVEPLRGGQYAHFRVEFASVMPSHHPGLLSVAVTSIKLPRYIISSCSYQT